MNKQLKLLATTIVLGLLFPGARAQSPTTPVGDTPLSDIFFLDLGIVIEPATGKEIYSRLVETTSSEVKLKVKTVESGSVYMAASKEMLAALQRIQERMDNLESSFRGEIASLRDENQELRGLLVDYARPPLPKPDRPRFSFPQAEEDLALLTDMTQSADIPTMKTIPVMKAPAAPKSQSTATETSPYLAGVIAYQKEDYAQALLQFKRIDLAKADPALKSNVLYWMADAHQQLGDYEAALADLDLLLKTQPSDRSDDALIQKGLLLRKTGHEDLALASFRVVVQEYPESEYLRLAQLELKKAELIP